MYDIDAYLEFTHRKLSREPFDAALALCAKGRRVLDELAELPEEESPQWRLLHERY
jgi:hypothetical protein